MYNHQNAVYSQLAKTKNTYDDKSIVNLLQNEN